MANTLVLAATKREITKHSAREAREEGRVPGVFYGKGMDPITLSCDASDVLRAYRQTGQGENAGATFTLELDGKKHNVIFQDALIHPVRHELHHVDFKIA